MVELFDFKKNLLKRDVELNKSESGIFSNF